MKKEDRAALAANLNTFIKATGRTYLGGIADNLIQEVECQTAILSDEEAKEPDFVFVSYLKEILFVDWDIKPEPGTWADKWLTGMGYHQDEPNDPRPFHYYMMHKRLVDRY